VKLYLEADLTTLAAYVILLLRWNAMLKQDVIDTIVSLPEDVTMEDIMYQLFVLDKHRKSLDDIDKGRVYSTDEIRASIII
jgi:hypothetical protein